MRIIFSDWVIALDKGRLPRQYDDGEPLEVVNAPDGWAWTLNTKLDGNLDVIPLTATNGVVGTTLSKSQLALAGDYWLQLTGTKDGVTRHTNIINMAVPISLSGDANWPTLPTAFSDALDRAEDAADRAESAATHGPRISGTNTWEVWDPDKGQYVDTMVDASGKTGPQGPAGAGMDITGATVGQIAKITAVDASGVPTAWEAVDMPSGGGVGELILDYIHDESKFPPGRPAIHPIAYDADTKVWTSDGSIDLTTIAAAGAAVNGRYQINIIDPLLQITQEFDRTKWNPLGTFALTILSANTFSTGDYVPPVIATDWSKYIMISNETVTINMPSNASDKIRMVFDGQFLGATNYSTFGTITWLDPNSRTTVSNENGYQQRRGIYNHIVCNFDLENGKIYGTVSHAFVSNDKIGSAYGVYYPYAATTWPQIVLSRGARVGYFAMPYKGRLRIYNRG